MPTLINIRPHGETPVLVNIDMMISAEAWILEGGVEKGTILRMACPSHIKQGAGGEMTLLPVKVTTSVPFREIIRRMRHEVVTVRTPPTPAEPHNEPTNTYKGVEVVTPCGNEE